MLYIYIPIHIYPHSYKGPMNHRSHDNFTPVLPVVPVQSAPGKTLTRT